MAYPTPTPDPTPIPLETPKGIDLSKNYRLTETQQIHVKDICIYINEIDQSFLPIDCSDIFPLNSAFGFLYDIIDHTTSFLETNSIYTQGLAIIQNSITRSDDQYEKRKIIYRYFALLRDMNLRIIYIFSNFHHIVDKIEDYEYHILYQQVFEKETFKMWLLSCNKSILEGSNILKDISLRTNLLNDEQLNKIYQKSSNNTYYGKRRKQR